MLSVAMRVSNVRTFTIKSDLKQSEEFENNHDNENHSDYVDYASVHARDSYQRECVAASIY
jgi:hypothetical protein